MSEPTWQVPRIPASAGALLFDERGRLLVLKPTYKRRWTIPGGQLEADGETPWQACRRETREECGIEIERGWLVCVDFRPAKDARRPGGLRFVFRCGVLGDDQHERISLQEEEIREHRFVDLDEAAELLSGPVRRRVLACVRAGRRGERRPTTRATSAWPPSRFPAASAPLGSVAPLSPRRGPGSNRR